MNKIPTINWKWDANSGILTITSEGEGNVLLEVDDSIYETGQNQASCTLNSAVGKTHHVKTCIYDNNSPESVVWKEESYTVPKMEQNNGQEPSVTENSSNQDAANQGISGLGPGGGGGGQTSDTRKYFRSIDVREKLYEMRTIKLPPTQFSNIPGNKTISFDSYIIPLEQPDNTSCWITSTVILLTAIGIIEPSKIKEILKSRSVDYLLSSILEHLYSRHRGFSFDGFDVPIPWSPSQTAFCNNFYKLKKYRRPLLAVLQKQFFETLNGFSSEPPSNYNAESFFKLLCDYGPLIVALDADNGNDPQMYHYTVLFGISILEGAEAQFYIWDSVGGYVSCNENEFFSMYNQMADDNLNATEIENALGGNKDFLIPQIIHLPNKIDLGL